MRQRSGVYLSDRADDFIAEKKACGESVALIYFDGSRCSNCQSDDGMIGLFVSGGNRPAISHSMSRAGHLYTFACPVCNDDTEARLAYLWSHSGLQANEMDWHIDYCANMVGKEAALNMARGLLAMTPAPEGWYSISGTYGVGKSGLMKSIVSGFIRAGVEAHYLRAEDILTEIRATFDKDNDANEGEVIRRYSNLRVLAIDEVGSDRMSSTQWALAKLFSIMDNRYIRKIHCATIIATNETPDSLQSTYGYLASRMKDGKRIVMGGDDLRGMKR